MVMSEGLPLDDGEGYVEVRGFASKRWRVGELERRGFASRIWRERLEDLPQGVECLNELKEEGLPLGVDDLE